MPKIRAVPPGREQEFARRWRSGESGVSLAADFGAHPRTMANTAERLGLPPRPSGAHREVLAQRQVANVLAGWDGGESSVALARSHGIGVWVVRRVLRENGRDPNRNGYGRERRGPDAHNWKGGRQAYGGYVRVYLYPEDPLFCMAGGNGYAAEHRVVMARHLGRPLLSSETVHHIDGDGHNNALDNLQLRQGRHGRGAAMACLDCGSHRIGAVPIAARG